MAKKSAISGEYIIQIEDSGSVEVYRIYENVIGSLREVAEAKGFEIDPKWNTRQTGANIIKAFGEGNQAIVGEYTIVKKSSGSIETYKVYDNVKGALREVADKVGFEFDNAWTTRHNVSLRCCPCSLPSGSLCEPDSNNRAFCRLSTT